MLKIMAVFIVLLALVGCGRTQKPLGDVVKEPYDESPKPFLEDSPPDIPPPISEEDMRTGDHVEPAPGDPSESPEVIGEVLHVPPLELPPLDYYAIVDAAFEKADTMAASGDPGLFFLSGNYHSVISAELVVPYSLEIDSEVAGAYRAAKGLLADAEVSREQTSREYLKLRLEFREKTHEEIMERLKQFYELGL